MPNWSAVEIRIKFSSANQATAAARVLNQNYVHTAVRDLNWSWFSEERESEDDDWFLTREIIIEAINEFLIIRGYGRYSFWKHHQQEFCEFIHRIFTPRFHGFDAYCWIPILILQAEQGCRFIHMTEWRLRRRYFERHLFGWRYYERINWNDEEPWEEVDEDFCVALCLSYIIGRRNYRSAHSLGHYREIGQTLYGLWCLSG